VNSQQNTARPEPAEGDERCLTKPALSLSKGEWEYGSPFMLRRAQHERSVEAQHERAIKRAAHPSCPGPAEVGWLICPLNTWISRPAQQEISPAVKVMGRVWFFTCLNLPARFYGRLGKLR